MMTQTIDTAELRGLIARATPGEWFCPERDDNPSAIKSDQGNQWAYVADFMDDGADRALVVALRNAAPALLDQLDAAQARVAALEAGLEDAQRDLGHVASKLEARCYTQGREIAYAGQRRARALLGDGA